MQCPHCQAENRKERRFCAECGKLLSLVCLACSFENEPDDKFCGGCGTPLDVHVKAPASGFTSPQSYTPQHLADKILQSKTALEGERKQVTALFCDITNSTALAERLGPEAMHSLLNRFFDLALGRIHRYEGTVNQFLGDGFMALFGAPIAHEDHARRAVLAALDLQHALQGFMDETSSPLQTRMGLNTGSVVVGAIGDNLRMDYTAVGDTTHLAARLQQAANPGLILISETTYRMVSGYCETQSIGELSLKGIVEPVHAREVISARIDRTRLEIAAERGLTPFVGREHEMRLLQECFEKAQGGQGQVVFIVGEPGIGKSRLLYEFRRWLGKTATWLEGHAISFGQSIAYYPLIDLLKRNFGVEEGDPDPILIKKIEQSVLRLGPDLETTLPYLYYLLGGDTGDAAVKKMDPQQRRGEIFDALRRLALRAAELRPQVMVFEDLHWMDQATEAFLRFVTDSIPASRILCIFTYRHGYTNPFEERTFHTRIPLITLSGADSVQMARAILSSGKLPETLQDLIVEKAEGNPFFVEEVINTLRETGAVKRSGDQYLLTKPLDDVFIPDTIQDVIMARIDHLAEEPKKTLQLASVIGRRFTYRLLDRLADIRGRTESYLQVLKALELIHEKDLFPELAYMFKHALTQDVAYNSLLEQRRYELHLLIGLAIEELYADRLTEQYDVLAYHFAKGQKWIKALDYLLKAADKATRSFANREAIALYDQALKIAEHPDVAEDTRTLMVIHRSRAGLFLVTSDFERSRSEGEIVLDLARRTADQRSEGEALTDLGYTALWMHDFDRAHDYGHLAVKVGERIEDNEVQAGGHFIIGDVQLISGRLDQAKKTANRVLAISRPANEMRYQSFALGILGHLKNWQGDYAQALQYLSEGLRIAQANNLLVPLFDNLFMYGVTLVGKGEYDKALSTLEEGMAFCAKVGDEVFYLRMMNTLGWLYFECGDLSRAVDTNRRAAEGARQRSEPETIANSELNLADAFLAQNDLAAARDTLEGVYRIVRNPATSEWMKWRYSTHLFASYGEVLLACGEIDKAAEFAQRCLQIAARTDSRKYLVKGLRLEGDIAFARRQWDDSEAAYRQALSIAQAIHNPTQLWKTQLALGQYYRRRRQPDKAGQSLRAAREVIDQVLSSLQTPSLRQSLKSDPLVQRVCELSAS